MSYDEKEFEWSKGIMGLINYFIIIMVWLPCMLITAYIFVHLFFAPVEGQDPDGHHNS